MKPRQYCPICGRRIVPFFKGQLQYQTDFGAFTTAAYISDSSEPICLGHDNTPPPRKVPQAFYDAFSDDEVKP